MKLFIANCSKMFCVLNYRLIEQKNGMSQNVDSGQQILVAKPDLGMHQITDLIEQLRNIGLYTVEELPTVPENTVIFWLASLDKPMTMKKIEEVFIHNDIALTNRGIETRKAAALAVNNNLAQRTPHAAGTMEITIQEESPTNSNAFGEKLIAEGYRMTTVPGDIGGR